MVTIKNPEALNEIPTKVRQAIEDATHAGVIPEGSRMAICRHAGRETHQLAASFNGTLVWFLVCGTCAADMENKSFRGIKNKLPVALLPTLGIAKVDGDAPAGVAQ